MTPDRHQQIKRLFLAAVELAPGEVEPFLVHACGSDDALRTDVQSLLDHHRTETLLGAGESAETVDRPATSFFPETVGPESTTATASPRRPAGTMIAGRYRLVAPLGRGGMGVVYRAEDTELVQTVALKFLSPALQGRPAAIELVRHEVRIARQITHPNVVRIFDIGTADGETFISMEFVAGEDLESLVRRVGGLPAAKVSQIARQLAAGLAAAHDAGILHRDLKPANVMIDGAGDVRILDFGIAAPLDDERALHRLSGTPGFIAPELLARKEPSERSDLYAWGIVVFFAATGRLPAAQSADDEAIDDRLAGAGISEELATVVGLCLQTDPQARPRSAHELVAALSANDPLQEAVYAGRMPSPALVAATSSWQPSPRLLHTLLGAGLMLVAVIALAANQTLFLSRCGLVKSPEALSEIAQQLLIRLRYKAPDGPLLTGLTLDADCLQYVRARSDMPGIWQKVSAGEIPAVVFWYRQGDPRLPRPALLGENTWQPARQSVLPVTTVELDGRGKLLFLQIDDRLSSDPELSPAIPWPELFEVAGLPWSAFHEVPADQSPPLFADVVRSWEGPLAVDGRQSTRVMAASLRGRLVYFDVEHPWRFFRASSKAGLPGNQLSRFIELRTALWLVAIAVAAWLARLHVQQGHADARGAWRLMAGVLILAGLDWLCGSRHSFIISEELAAASDWLMVSVFCGAIAGVAFLAVEPSARRWWPWSIITLRRLLDGRISDAGIWADVLLGLVVGLGAVFLRQLCTLTNQVVGIAVSGLNDFDPGQNLLDHFGFRYRFAVFVTALLFAVLQSLLLLTLVVGLKRIVKSTLAAAVIVVVCLAALSIVGRGILSPVDWLARTMLLSIAAGLLLRFGLLASIAALATYYAVNNAPITLAWSAWYAPTAILVLTMIVAALAGSWSLARRQAV